MTTHLTDTQKQTIRIALARWSGHEIYEWGVKYPGHDKPTWRGYKSIDEMLPNYPASLDACHAIEVKLTDTEHRKFRNWIEDIALQSSETPEEFHRESVSPRAENRSLALYRSLNLGELGD